MKNEKLVCPLEYNTILRETGLGFWVWPSSAQCRAQWVWEKGVAMPTHHQCGASLASHAS